ncbi:SnoaL-like domain-containing protein [Pedobacter sp. NJ-S-72]
MEQTRSMEISDPLVIGEFFCFRLKMNFNLKDIGKSALNESWVFEVEKDKIIYERFFNCNSKQILV